MRTLGPVAADRYTGRKLGAYILEGLLGKGGMGTVYRARDPQGQVVAVKVLEVDDESATSTMAARFKREIEACMGTDSQHVIKVYGAGTEADCHWYAMELLEGYTLQQQLKARGRLPMDDVYRITSELAEALGHIHARGIIHRDLKPGNIMIVRSGRTVLMDFGLAKVEDRTRITKTGHGLGTPRYMAPEMLLAKPPTPATDMYQVGVILYEMLTGETVVKAKSFATLAHELTRVYPPEISSIDPSLDESLNNIVFNCLEKDQKLRYQSAAEFLADLRTHRAGGTVTGRGSRRTLKLGESSGEIDQGAVTAENPTPRLGRAPPDSRPEAGEELTEERGTAVVLRPSSMRPAAPAISRLRGASSSFATVPVDTEDSLLSLTQPEVLLTRLRRNPAGALAAAVLVLVLLAYALRPGWEGDTRLRGPVRVTVSPEGAAFHFETLSQVPGAVRLFRFLSEGPEARLDSVTRDYRAADEAPGHTHQVMVDRLVEGRRYAGEVIFPDGSSAHRVEFAIPRSEVAAEVALTWASPGGAELAFSVGFPVRGRIRQGESADAPGLNLEGEPRSEWRVPIPLADPFQAVDDLYLELTGAAGWSRRFGPYSFRGLDGQAIQRLQGLDVRGLLEEVEAVRTRQPAGADQAVPVLRALKERLQEAHIQEVLQRLRPHVAGFFQRSDVPFENRRDLFVALQRLAPLDYYCLARNLPPLLDVWKVYTEFLTVGSGSFFVSATGSVLEGVRTDVVSLLGSREVLRPVEVPAERFAAAIEPSRQLFGSLPASTPRRTLELSLPAPVPPVVELVIEARNLHPDYYLEVEVNGALPLLIHNPEPSRALQRLEDLPWDSTRLRTTRVARLPKEVLLPGRNRVVLQLHTVGPVLPFPASVERVAVYYRLGSP